jgi:predicted ATPase
MSATQDVNLIRTPDRRLRVFVSSTLRELASEREAVRSAIGALRLSPVMFELGSRPHPPRELYRAYLAQSDVFVGLYWQSYGLVAPGEERSGLEEEYEVASRLPKLVYIKNAPQREPRLEELLDRIRQDEQVAYKRFSTTAELRQLVEDDLALLLSERFETAQRAEAAPDGGDWEAALPVPPTPLVGREREVEDVSRLLLTDEVREVTLTGPGGVGKTRLALTTGAALRPRFDDGVVFAALTSVTAPDLVATALAGALGLLRSGAQVPIDDVISYLANKRMLLVIDNFEQVSEAAPLITEVLSAAPGVKVLTTSRARLRLTGEHEFTVAPLSVPRPDGPADVERLERSPAVQLFVARARASLPDFELTADNAWAVAEIARRLDGLPLAIELAAARVRLLPPQALLDRLSDRLGLLTGGARDMPERQRALRSTMAWSYDLLEPTEQSLFAWLGVFAGGFDLEAVEEVWRPGGGSAAESARRPDALDSLGSLVDNSLVSPSAGDGEPHFMMLDTIRDYALEQLRAGPDWQEARERHAAYYSALAEKSEQGMRGAEQADWFARLESEHDNLRAALSFLIEEGQLEPAIGLVKGSAYWWYRGHVEEGFRVSERILSRGGSLSAPARAQALATAGAMAFGFGKPDTAHNLAEQSLALFHQLGDPPDTVRAIVCVGQAAMLMGDNARATEVLEGGLALARRDGDDWYAALLLDQIGLIPLATGDYGRAAQRFDQALALSRRLGDRTLVVLTLGNLAQTEVARGELGTATRHMEEGLSLASEVDDALSIAHFLDGLGAIAQRQDDTERAGRLHGAAQRLRVGFTGSTWQNATGGAPTELAPERPTGTAGVAFERASAEGAAMDRRRAVRYALRDQG